MSNWICPFLLWAVIVVQVLLDFYILKLLNFFSSCWYSMAVRKKEQGQELGES